MKKSALLCAALVAAGFNLVSCGGGTGVAKPPSGLTTRIFASQSVSGSTSAAGVVIVNGENDTIARASVISAGTSPGLMAISSDRTTVLVYDSISNAVQVLDSKSEKSAGSIQLPGPINSPVTSMVALDTGFAYIAVPAAPVNGVSGAGALVVLNLQTGGTTATISVPNAQTVVASPDGTHLLVFSNDSDLITVVSPLLVNTGVTVTTTVAACTGCRPAYAVFSSDSSTAYILNCGAECGGSQAGIGTPASVQTLNMAALDLGTSVPVDGATVAFLSGSTLYVAGNSPTNSSCSGETTAATTCGRLNTVDLGSLSVTNRVVITDGYHDRIDISANGQLFIGSHTCTTIGNVNNQQGEVRGCLSIFNTTNGEVVIPPDNGDVTGLQSLTSRYVEYVAEGGNLRVYDTTQDKLIANNDFITNGTITITGRIIDIKAVDFF